MSDTIRTSVYTLAAERLDKELVKGQPKDKHGDYMVTKFETDLTPEQFKALWKIGGVAWAVDNHDLADSLVEEARVEKRKAAEAPKAKPQTSRPRRAPSLPPKPPEATQVIPEKSNPDG